MVELNIEDCIHRELSSEEQKVAMSFVSFLKDNQLSFYRDNCACWKDKIYYWVKLDNECVCFIAIKDPDEKDNHWTVWSADMGSQWLEKDYVDDDIKETAWKYVDHCGRCGSCGGGRNKIIFGKEFDDVCGCTFRIDNPKNEDILFLKEMVEIRMKEIKEQTMGLYDRIKNYRPTNRQEECDKEQMLQFMRCNDDYLVRENQMAHFTASMWVVNKERTKTLMVHHNLYNSWSWIGGHADGMEDLCAVALKELQEETGVRHVRLVSEEIFSLETLTVNGHMRKGIWVPGHLHFNLTYLAEVEESEGLTVQQEENSGVQWWSFEEALRVSSEPWMVEHVYKKLIEKSKTYMDK